ncbi:Peptide deformylase [Carbonactinospora thermoautotrophica]|uniref:Peptide deformylase n=1 Tax=Carbonactinospora thermoautotrophica TaxID=1469144 RepID=A0A132MXQ0_9ACTN|nr:Peptide deformylase [Carbonactinospora thermoautotrophica]
MEPPTRSPRLPYRRVSRSRARPAACWSSTTTPSCTTRVYRATQRRKLYNATDAPVTRYLIRISVDRYPGNPERSNRLYREHPLTWEEINLQARCGNDPMRWKVQHDRDAFKEVWLLFENEYGRFPLYPGESTWIEYSYTVGDDKWGNWFQRAVRLPTKRLSVRLDFPAELDPVVWGMETTMTAEAFPFRTAISQDERDGRRVFSWSTENPPLHARYRLEWKFRARSEEKDAGPVTTTASETMRSLGVVQEGDPILRQVARPFDLPVEAEDARRVVAELHSAMERVANAHVFVKGMGIAAPQIGIDRAAAIVRFPTGEIITLLNPRVIEESDETDEKYEGCLSFFDVRGMVPRPLAIQVEHQDIDGQRRITIFERGDARLVAHEIDHLEGKLYTDRMRPGVKPIPVSEYRGTGQTWQY